MAYTFFRMFDEEGIRKHEVLVSTDADYLPDLLQDIEGFLQACGFQIKGTLAIVEDDNPAE